MSRRVVYQFLPLLLLYTKYGVRTVRRSGGVFIAGDAEVNPHVMLDFTSTAVFFHSEKHRIPCLPVSVLRARPVFLGTSNTVGTPS